MHSKTSKVLIFILFQTLLGVLGDVSYNLGTNGNSITT